MGRLAGQVPPHSGHDLTSSAWSGLIASVLMDLLPSGGDLRCLQRVHYTTIGFAEQQRQGRASYSMEFYRYEELPPDLAEQHKIKVGGLA